VDRERPPVTVTAPGSGGAPPDVLQGAPPRSGRRWPTAALVLVAVVVLGVAAVRGQGETAAPAPSPPAGPPPAPPPELTPTSGITATASVAGATTDQPYVQRLTLTVGLPAYDGRSDSGGRLLGDEILLLDVSVRGFTLEPDDPRSPLPLGRFGRSTSGRTTTVPLAATAVVDDCAVEPQARRDIVLTVATGDGPDGVVRAVAEPAVVRALDQLVSRTCRRPRG
jgi:hypothetical protein